MLASRRRVLRLSLVIVTAVLAVLLGACARTDGGATQYQCPMHPTYISDKPGDCPICAMRLVPVQTAKRPASGAAVGTGAAGLAPIDVDPEGLRLAGVRTAVAEHARIDRTIRAVGVVRPEETRIRHVHTKTSGYVEKLFIDFTGQPVKKGRPILSFYSPELLASQQEYARAREAAAGLPKSNNPAAREAAEQMLAGARRRLELFDVPASSIAEIERSGATRRAVTLLAPVSGIVTSKGVFEGMQIDPGTELFTVSDLSWVWIEADVYENEASVVTVGQEAKLTLAYQPGIEMKGKVKYIYPYLNPDTRTLKVRFDFPNPGLALKLDMYVAVELPVQSEEGVVVPDSAVMDTGARQIVFVNPAAGRFEPRLVKVGIRAEGRAQILSGIAAGERVAIKANFLLDSESRLRSAISVGAAR
jgi:membrane fusion protein, copper/silver efflux system